MFSEVQSTDGRGDVPEIDSETPDDGFEIKYELQIRYKR